MCSLDFPGWLMDFLGPVCMYPLVLRFDVFVGVARIMRTLSEGSETTITAVHISAVHQQSAEG
jgi:hypothetical protein